MSEVSNQTLLGIFGIIVLVWDISLAINMHDFKAGRMGIWQVWWT